MRIYIVRHGDKEKGDYYNESLRHHDSPLSEDGKQRAKKLYDYFEDKQIKRIITSEYLRTNQTAQYIAESKGLQVVKDKRLNEIDNGIVESMSDEEIEEKYPDFWKDFFSYSKDVRFPEGEAGEDVKARQKDLLDELMQKDEDVLLISHEGYIRLLMCYLLDIPVYKRNLFRVDMCGILEFEYDKKIKAWIIIKFNHTLDI